MPPIEFLRACFDNGLGACVQLILTFALMVWLLRRKLAVGYALLAGCAFLAVSSWMPARQVFGSLKDTATNLRTINLFAIVVLITFMGEVLGHVENLAQLVQTVLGLVRSRKAAMGMLPAIVGLLPMPGGAMLSAPMVEELGREINAPAESKTLINHWFRHIWEYSCPLYPGIVLLASMMGKSVIWFILYNLPLSLTAVLAGIVVCFRDIPKECRPTQAGRRGILPLLGAVWPVGFVILCTAVPLILLAGGANVPAWAGGRSAVQWPLIGAICVVIFVLYVRHRISWSVTRPMLAKAFKLDLMALVYGVMLLRNLLNATGAAADVQRLLSWLSVPDMIVLFILPFSVGMLTGVTVAFVSISIGVLEPYLLTPDVDHFRVMFAFASGFMGVMISPVHLCFVLALDYFKAERARVYRRLIPLGLIVIAVAAAIALAGEILK